MDYFKLKTAFSLAFKCGLVVILFTAIPAFVSSSNCISCKCGTNSVNYTHCTENESKETFSCEKWAQCQSCRDNSTYCVTCPYKRFGPFCTEGAVPITHGHRQKRVYYSSSCEKRRRFFNGVLQVHPPLNAPPHSIDDTELPVGTRLIYSCYPGYVLQGQPNQICKDTGFWSGEPAACIKEKQIAKCPDPGTPEGASRESFNGTDESEERIFLEGEALYFYCDDEDYVIVPERAQVINCTSFGSWTDTLPRCQMEDAVPVFCNFPGVTNYSILEDYNEEKINGQSQAYIPGAKLRYRCRAGYEIFGSSDIFCLLNGEWSDDPPSCRELPSTTNAPPIFCNFPGLAENSILEDDNGTKVVGQSQAYIPGAKLSYLCRDGYKIIGSSDIFCLFNGEWSADPPLCGVIPPKIPCRELGDFGHGHTSGRKVDGVYPVIYELQFKCHSGYLLRGLNVLFCIHNGSWTGEKPSCMRGPTKSVSCKQLGDVEHGAFEDITRTRSRLEYDDGVYPVGYRLVYFCLSGYVLEGYLGTSAYLNCTSNGRWTSEKPRCIIKG